jgi:xylose isomerase
MAEAFTGIGRIAYEGPGSKSMLAFRHYNPDALVEGKPMRDHLRFAVSYWHTFSGTGSDPFGAATMIRPWEIGGDSLAAAVAFAATESAQAFVNYESPIVSPVRLWPDG